MVETGSDRTGTVQRLLGPGQFPLTGKEGKKPDAREAETREVIKKNGERWTETSL